MSIVAMNWAWARQLPPTVKLVLMSLADAADDQGVCWPSIPTVARKCGVSTRSVRRVMGQLEAAGLLRREPRFRNDGSSSSNRYTLALGGDDKLSGAAATDAGAPGQGCPGPADRRVRPGTTNGSHREPPPQPSETLPAAPAEPPPSDVGADDDDDGGGDDDHHHRDRLEYPKELSETERAEAAKKLQALPPDLAQQVLDELAGRMKAGSIRIAPLAYLRGLVKRARTGKFTPDIALQVADGRERRRQAEAARRRAEAAHREALERHGCTAAETRDNPLVRRLNAIRDRSGCPGGDDD